MKKFTIIVTVLIAVTITTIAQTAADYYLPLCVGNYLRLHSTGNDARTTFYRIMQTETINNETYYVQKGSDSMDNNSSKKIFQYSWLRRDANGNILIGAYDPTLNGILDSSVINNPPGLFFPNQFLTLGYSRSFTWGDAVQTDSVISVSAIVGTYTNCIQIRNTEKIKGVVDRMYDSYYASHIGLIEENRFFPDNEIRVLNIVDFLATNCYSTGISDGFVNKKEFNIYPNPASDVVNLNIVNGNNSDLTLNIYNVIGKLIISESLQKNQQQINTVDLSNGIYMVEIKSKGWTENQKLIIKR